MPSSLKYFRKRPSKIPKSKWKGSGYYYNRGKNEWTKWSRSKDLKRGRGVGSGKFKHTHDKRRR